MDLSQTEEFAGFVKLRLVEKDYAIIRAFGERSSFGTYLTTVISRLLNDYRNHEWGKWHDSAEAKRSGDAAVELERLLVRDGHSLDDAAAILTAKYPEITRSTIDQLAQRFPVRHRRKTVSIDDHPLASDTDEPQDHVMIAELSTCVSKVVNLFVRKLDRQDQLLFQLRFSCELPVPQIAVALHDNAQVLYRRLRAHMRGLRVELERAGINAKDVARLIGSDAALLDFGFKSDGERPSNDDEHGAEPEENA